MIPMVFGGDIDRWLTGPEIRSGLSIDGYSSAAFSDAVNGLITQGVLRREGPKTRPKYALNDPSAMEEGDDE
jgi:hypothetical protein